MQTSCMRLPGSSRDSSAFPRCLRSLIGICLDLGEPNSVSISTWRSNRKAEHLVLPGGVTKSPLRCGRGSVATFGLHRLQKRLAFGRDRSGTVV